MGGKRQTRPIRALQAVAIGPEGVEAEALLAPVEAPLTVAINDRPVAVLMRLPGDDRDLALGYCLTEGLVGSPEQVRLVWVCEDDPDLIHLTVQGDVPDRPGRFVPTGCGTARAPEDELRMLPPALVPGEGPWLSAEVLLALGAKLREVQVLQREAHTLHCSALFSTSGELIASAEDVGRHNTIDKLVGRAARERIELPQMVLVTTGRSSSDMVLKAAAVRIPLVASVSGPTTLGADLAESLGVTLVGYLRGRRATVYTHGQRIALPQPAA